MTGGNTYFCNFHVISVGVWMLIHVIRALMRMLNIINVYPVLFGTAIRSSIGQVPVPTQIHQMPKNTFIHSALVANIGLKLRIQHLLAYRHCF